MYEESIYNLIPKEYVPPPKKARYKSKHNPVAPPTGSTFNNNTTSRPNVRHPTIQIFVTVTFIGVKSRRQQAQLPRASHA